MNARLDPTQRQPGGAVDPVTADAQRWLLRYLAPLLALALAVTGLYAGFLSSPVVFDDFSYFGKPITDNLASVPDFGLRWLSIATFVWVRAAMGPNLAWQHLLNLVLHVANSWLLYVFLLRLFGAVLVEPKSGLAPGVSRQALSLPWLAFLGAWWFALNPSAVYGVAYLVQRTIVMATLFALSSWLLFLEGLLRDRRRWLLLSSVAYLLAVLSKEHAIMVPAVALMLLVLLRRPGAALLREVGPTCVLYAAIAIFTILQIRSGGVIGSAYEPSGAAMLEELNVDPQWAYALSVLTQTLQFFKYIALWLLPYPGWMSVDMPAHFARSLWSWPESAALLFFFLYPVLALRWLMQRGRKGLLGFALLGPWLLFATELSTVRALEIFVLYRSYLWIPCAVAALPFLLRSMAARHVALLFALLTALLVAGSWNRLTSFSDPLLLWDDTLRLGHDKDETTRLGRMHHNRGVALSGKKRFQEAISAFDAGLKILPYYSPLFTDRGVAYLERGQYQQALRDFNRAIMLDATYYNPYLGRSQVYEALGNREAARQDYASSCRLGVVEVCARAH